MKDILTCQNHPDVDISHAETLVFLPIGKGVESRARILTEASKLGDGDQRRPQRHLSQLYCATQTQKHPDGMCFWAERATFNSLTI